MKSKKWHNDLIYKMETLKDGRHRSQIYGCQRGKEGDKLGVWN